MPSAKTTPNLGLNAWEGNETVRREDFYNDNQKVDKAVGDLKTAMENIDLVDSKVQVEDKNNKFTATTLDKVLDEIDDKIVDTSNKVDNIDLAANKVKYTDTTTQLGAINVQQAIEKTVAKATDENKKLDTKINTEIGNLRTEVKDKVGKFVIATLAASKWAGNTYSFEAEYPFAQYIVYVCGYADTASVAQRDAYSDAELASVLTDQTIKALGTKPTIDIPVVLEVVKKWQ